MIIGELGRRGGFHPHPRPHRGGRGGFGPGYYGYGPAYEYPAVVEPVVLNVPICTAPPNSPPPCTGRLYWQGNTICCGR